MRVIKGVLAAFILQQLHPLTCLSSSNRLPWKHQITSILTFFGKDYTLDMAGKFDSHGLPSLGEFPAVKTHQLTPLLFESHGIHTFVTPSS